MRAKTENRVWKGLKDGNCPRCNQPVQKGGLFNDKPIVACPGCGFALDKETHDLLIKRDYDKE